MISRVTTYFVPSRGLLRLLVISACSLFLSSAVLAQNVAPSQVTPPTLRPPPTGGGGGVVLPEVPGLRIPVGADQLSVTIGRVEIEGAFPELASANESFIEAIRGRRLTVAQIYQLAGALEQAYAVAGYVLARVTIPQQKLVDGGRLRIVVIDGFVEEVNVDAVPERVRRAVALRMASLVGRRHVKLVDIERPLLITSDMPGLTMRSTLARGSTLGGTKLIIEATQKYVSGSIGVDNRLEKSLKTWESNASLALNSIFGIGEQIYGSVIGGTNLHDFFDGSSPIRVFGGGAVIPIGFDGWIVNPEYTTSKTRPIPALGTPAVLEEFDRFSLRTSYPLIRTRSQTLNVLSSTEWIKENNLAIDFGTELYRDQYSVERAGLDWQVVLPWSASLQLNGLASFGLGGRNQADAVASGIPLSRLGSSPDFTKISGMGRYFQSLPADFQFVFIARAQSSLNKPLFVAEQFQLEGIDAVSAFPAGTFSVDQGYSLRGELIRPFTIAFSGGNVILAPYLFAATARGTLQMPTAVEQPVLHASSLGLGIRAGANAANGAGATFNFEVARQYTDVIRLHEGWRSNVVGSIRF